LVLGVSVAAQSAAGPSFAQPQPQDSGKPRVFVFPFIKGEGVSDVVFNKVEQYFLTLFQMSAKLTVVTEQNLKSEVQVKEKEKKREEVRSLAPWLDKADNLLWKGKDLIVKKSYKDAIEVLQEAKDLYEENYLELRDYDKLVDATLQLSIAFFGAGYMDNGEELLKDVLVWRPTLVVDKKKYPKELVESLEKLRALMENRKGGVLRVEAVPAEGAKVFVDGLLKGTLAADKPGVDITDLYRGTHYVQVMHEQHKVWAKKVGVPEVGRTAKEVAKLETLPQETVAVSEAAGDLEGESFKVYQYALEGDYGPKFSKSANAFAEKAQTPYLLFAFVSKEPKGTKLTLFLFKSAWSATAEVEPVAFDDNLTNLQVNLLFLEANLASALANFPKNRVVRDVPEVYVRSKELAQAKAAPPVPVVAPVPVVKPPVAVAPPVEKPVERPPVAVAPPVEKPAVKPPVVVVKPEVRKEPFPPRVAPTVTEAPVLPTRTEPQKEEDLGELSSIFAGGNGDGEPAPYVATGIPLGPTITTGPTTRTGEGDITKKWWFWAGVAAGVGVVGGGGYLLYNEVSGPSGAEKYSASFNWAQ